MIRLEHIDVTELLPQRPPFVLIDRLTGYDDRTATTVLEVRAGNVFVEDGLLDACAYVEIIAQTCAARLGYVNKYIYQRDVCIGVIGAVRNLTVVRPARVGETLTTTICVRGEVMSLTLVDATVRVGEETVCTAEMKIAVEENDNA